LYRNFSDAVSVFDLSGLKFTTITQIHGGGFNIQLRFVSMRDNHCFENISINPGANDLLKAIV
jgi:hypothetical protein